jgi:predicted kinase
MTKLIITRGYPGSGKTTRAREWVTDLTDENHVGPWRARVNRDDLRASLFGASGVLSWEREQAITKAQQNNVRNLLRTGYDVIVDDTNLRLRFARAWADLALEEGAEFEVWDITTPVDACVAHDRLRDRTVGERVIREIAQRFPMPWPEVKPSESKADHQWPPYTNDWNLLPAWLVDIDGTLADMGDRGPFEWHRVGEDTVHERVADLVRTIHESGDQIVFMSGRSMECYGATRRWLADNIGDWTVGSPLHMREEGDNRSDDIVKNELFETYVRGSWNVLGVLDDRDKVVAMWRAKGLTCLQVAPGDF